MVAIVQVGQRGRARKSQLIPKICPYCLEPFKGVRQKTYCSKYCNERACRRRKEALIDALWQYFQVYGMERRHVEGCVELWLKRSQQVAAWLGLAYDEREKAWKAA